MTVLLPYLLKCFPGIRCGHNNLFCAKWLEFGDETKLLLAYDFRILSEQVKSLSLGSLHFYNTVQTIYDTIRMIEMGL